MVKAAHSLHLFKDPEYWSYQGLEPSPSPKAFQRSTTWANQAKFNGLDNAAFFKPCMLMPPHAKVVSSYDNHSHFGHDEIC